MTNRSNFLDISSTLLSNDADEHSRDENREETNINRNQHNLDNHHEYEEHPISTIVETSIHPHNTSFLDEENIQTKQIVCQDDL